MSDYPKIHLSITVSDLERSVDFYTRFFGAEPVKTKEGYAKFLPDFAPLNVALETGSADINSGRIGHMGIQVADREAVVAQLQRIKATGLETKEEMNVDCCYANQDKFWVEDPDGAHWEIYVLNRDIDELGGSAVLACCEEAETVAQSADSEACCAPSCCS